ncbi:hypothetical protein [Desertivirga xinjiangensis]|uniref:hypothetical protein n=1 Tax=Desertivirga xinjiangensis TaxID=539206 RepID=UPI00210922E5|nr:hypothetical protein [Pedobacter xinjiangensis]
MKKALLSLIFFGLLVSGFASTNKGEDDSLKITPAAISWFKAEFKTAVNVTWVLGSDYQKAMFTIDGKKLTALFDLKGNYLASTQTVAFDEIPESAKAEIAKSYKDYNFSSALLIVKRSATGVKSSTDAGTYWIDLATDNKQVYLNYSSNTGVVLYKTIFTQQNASN